MWKHVIEFFVAAVLATGCMPVSGGGSFGGSFYGGGSAQTVTTGVYVNNVELDATSKAKLDWLLDYTVPAGRYYVTETGWMGVVGQQPSINLVAYAEAKGIDVHGNQNRGSSTHFNGNSGDNITSYGNCVSASFGSTTFLGSGC